MRTRKKSGTWAGLGYSREKPGRTAQVLEDRAHPLALPQREAAEDHGNCPIRQLVVQFSLSPLSTMEPIGGIHLA